MMPLGSHGEFAQRWYEYAVKMKDELSPQVWVLLGATFVVAMGFGLIGPVLPQFAETMAAQVFPDNAVTATTFVMSSFAVVRLLWASPAGMLVTRLGEKTIYVWAMFICALSAGAIAFATNYWQLLAFRAAGGVGSVMFTVSAMGLLIKIAPEHMRGRVSALYGSSFLLGNVLGPVVGGTLAGWGTSVPFLSYAVMLLLAGLIMFVFMPATTAAATSTEEQLPPVKVWEALQNRAYVANLIAMAGQGWANYGVRFVMVPLFIAATITEESWVAGVAMGIFAVGNATALPFASSYADRAGRKPTMILGLALSGGFMMLLGLATNTWLVLLFCLVAGLGTGTFMPSSNAVVADIVGRERSGNQVIALTQMVTDVGAIIGPPLAGLIVDGRGYGPAFLVSGAILVVGAGMWLAAPETLPTKSQTA
ncbi:MAG: MFS transporter [Propionibacteriaceae bacterium]|nr:MFS transporter [Propionibacteriaceae bacterium]